MAGQKMSLEEATSARLPFDVAEHIDIEEEKEEKRKVEEYKQARAEHLKTVSKMAFTQQCIDDKIMPSKKQNYWEIHVWTKRNVICKYQQHSRHFIYNLSFINFGTNLIDNCNNRMCIS